MERNSEIKPWHAVLLSLAVSIVLISLWHSFEVPYYTHVFVIYVLATAIPSFLGVLALMIKFSASPGFKVFQCAVFVAAVFGVISYYGIAQKNAENLRRVSREAAYKRYQRESRLEEEARRLSPEANSALNDLIRENELLRDRATTRE